MKKTNWFLCINSILCAKLRAQACSNREHHTIYRGQNIKLYSARVVGLAVRADAVRLSLTLLDWIRLVATICNLLAVE